MEGEIYRLAFDTVWDWAERRGVRVEYWRDGQEWQVEVILCDTEGDFSGHMPLHLFRTTKNGTARKLTQTQLHEAYIRDMRAALDAAVTEARFRRGKWQKGRLR